MAKKKKKAASTNYKTGPLLQSACKPFFDYHSWAWRDHSGENHIQQRKIGESNPVEFI